MIFYLHPRFSSFETRLDHCGCLVHLKLSVEGYRQAEDILKQSKLHLWVSLVVELHVA